MLIGLALGQEPTEVPPTDPHIRYIGRWDFRDPQGPRAEWSASAFEFRFQGKQVTVHLGGKANFWQATLDGVSTLKITLASGGRFTLTAADGLPHTYRFTRNLEAFAGPDQVKGLGLTGGELLPVTKPERRLEVIGDSISCGYGDEGPNEHEHFKPETENAYLSYGSLAANALHADFTDIAWSGRKMWPDNTIPSIYDLTLPDDPTSTWAFTDPAPQAVVINLATNDFGRAVPDEQGWTSAYSAFIHHVRTHYPSARVYLAIGTMMSDDYPPGAQHLTILRRYLTKVLAKRVAAGDKNCAILDFGVQDGAHDGLGSDYHPNLKTHAKMAAKLEDALHRDLGW